MIYTSAILATILAQCAMSMKRKSGSTGVEKGKYYHPPGYDFAGEKGASAGSDTGTDDAKHNSMEEPRVTLIATPGNIEGRLELIHCDQTKKPFYIGGGISGRVYKVRYTVRGVPGEYALKVCQNVGSSNQEIKSYEMIKALGDEITGVNAPLEMWSEKYDQEKREYLTRTFDHAFAPASSDTSQCQFLLLPLCEKNLQQAMADERDTMIDKLENATEDKRPRLKETLVNNLTCKFFKWAKELAGAYINIHRHNLIHIDGKMDNVIMTRRGNELVPILTDLDAMYQIAVNELDVDVKGHAHGRSWGPEIKYEGKACKASDIHAFGHTIETMYQEIGGSQRFSKDRIGAFIETIMACKNPIPAKRPVIADVYELMKCEHVLAQHAAGVRVEEKELKKAETESDRLMAKLNELSRPAPPAAEDPAKCRCTVS